MPGTAFGFWDTDAAKKSSKPGDFRLESLSTIHLDKNGFLVANATWFNSKKSDAQYLRPICNRVCPIDGEKAFLRWILSELTSMENQTTKSKLLRKFYSFRKPCNPQYLAGNIVIVSKNEDEYLVQIEECTTLTADIWEWDTPEYITTQLYLFDETADAELCATEREMTRVPPGMTDVQLERKSHSFQFERVKRRRDHYSSLWERNRAHTLWYIRCLIVEQLQERYVEKVREVKLVISQAFFEEDVRHSILQFEKKGTKFWCYPNANEVRQFVEETDPLVRILDKEGVDDRGRRFVIERLALVPTKFAISWSINTCDLRVEAMIDMVEVDE